MWQNLRFNVRRSPVAFVATAVLALLTSPTWAQAYKDLNGEAIQALRSGDFAQSETLFKKALSECPSGGQDEYDKVIKSNMALLYRKMGKVELAAQMDAESCAGQKAPSGPPQIGAVNSPSNKECVDFARSQVNRVVYMKTKSPKVITVESCKAMKRTDGKVLVKVSGYHGDKSVAVDIVVARAADGTLSVAESTCDMFYRAAASDSSTSSASSAGISSSGGSILSGTGGGAFSAGGMGGCGGSGGGGCIMGGGGGAYSGGF